MTRLASERAGTIDPALSKLPSKVYVLYRNIIMSSQKGIFDNAPITIECNGEKFLIAIANGEMVNINQLHVASGKKNNQSPRDWLKQDNVKQLVDAISKKYNVISSHIIETKRGKGGYTMVHWQLINISI